MLLMGTFFAVSLDTVSADLVDGDYTYFVQNGESTITGYIGAGGAITIPSIIGGHPAVAIGENAFMNCISLTSVIIPNSVTIIDNSGFLECSHLTSVTIPNSVTTIGNCSFQGCSSLISVTIPDSVNYIASATFQSCSSLTSATIGSGVTFIGNHTFSGCFSLTAINVDATNVDYASIDGVLYNKTITALIQYPNAKAGSFIIPSSVITIEESSFSDNHFLTSVTIPNSVTTIGISAFNPCSNLTSVNMGSGVTTIQAMAFQSCTSLTSIIIPRNVTTIGIHAFSGCRNLTSVTIRNGVTTIGTKMFTGGCDSLTSITIPSSVTTIGESAFNGCHSLNSINFLGLVAPTSVGQYWIDETGSELTGHAYAISNFPPPGNGWNGLMMGTVLTRENELPIASFTWMPSNPTVNQTITFDASASTDLDGSLTLYEWDWNNDGTYEDSHATPTATHSWTQPGNYSVTARVTDNNNSLTNTKTITVPVSSSGGGGNGDTDNKGTPGFELIIVIGAIALVFLLKRKSKK